MAPFHEGAACAAYLGGSTDWLRLGGTTTLVALLVAAFAMGAVWGKAGWTRGAAVACLALFAAIGSVDWRMSDLERAMTGLCNLSPMLINTGG